MKSSEKRIYVRNLGIREAEIKAYVEVQEDDSFIYQNFRLVASNFSVLKYFLESKFSGYYRLEDEINKYFLGDVENIEFDRKIVQGNLLTVIYKKKNSNANIRFKEAQFKVRTTVPENEGCRSCTYWRKKNKKCLYYGVLGMKKRENCADFRQKEELTMEEKDKSKQILIEQIAEKLGTSVQDLLERYSDIDSVIEKYRNGELKLLND
jgi:hypothetical protein